MGAVSTIVIPLPDRDFDVTEVSVPWRVLRDAGHRVVFSTERGATPAADPLLLSGVIFGMLGAKARTIAIYRELERDPAFLAPIEWSAIDPEVHDAMILPGGHARGMRQYLGSEALRERVGAFWASARPVAAICHGVLVLARAKDPASGRSLLEGRRTTCLPKYMERSAWMLTAWKLGDYYRTYPEYVEDEVRAALGSEGRFERGPRTLIAHGTESDDRAAFVVEDGSYVSARWPGDAYLFARTFAERLAPSRERANDRVRA
jgi:putative intracellular protease/amidase